MSRFGIRTSIFAVAFIIAMGVESQSSFIRLVTAGKSNFTICIDPKSSSELRANADTLRKYIHTISSVDIPVTSRFTNGKNQIVIEVGKSRDKTLDLVSLGNDGFRIKTFGENIYISSLTNYGAQNAIYTFLESYLECRMFSPWVKVIPKQDSIVLGEIDDIQIPKIKFRMQDFKDSSYAAWHKLNSNAAFGLFVHTFHDLVPPERYFKEHPEYFSENQGFRTPKGQLCLSNPEVIRIVVSELKERMKIKPEAAFWSVSQNDTYLPCQCSACRAIDSLEGSPSGSILRFVNMVADSFPNMTISTLAYQYSRSAPKITKPKPNVNIMLCSIECERSRPLADNPGAAAFVQDVDNWRKLTSNIFMWDYVINFRNLVSPYPNLRTLQPNIQFFVRSGIHSVFEQGLAVMRGEFAELRAYLISKLLWNPDINIDSVMNDFLAGFYGPAAPMIRRYIDTMHEALARSGEELSPWGYPISSADGYLSPEMIDMYCEVFDSAEAKVVESTDYLERVQTARLPMQFAILEQAKMAGIGKNGCFQQGIDGGLIIKPEIDSLLISFVQRCKRAEIPRLWEHGTSPDEYFKWTRRYLDDSVRPHKAVQANVTLANQASPKYNHGQISTLTDGLRGWNDYHFHWLGFEGDDLDATIDLGSIREISQIKTDFLQDINSWVFMPSQVEFWVSADGQHYQRIGLVENSTPQDKYGAIIAPFDITFDSRKVRYVRVKGKNIGTCPAWHKGAGGKAWIFTDEISIY